MLNSFLGYVVHWAIHKPWSGRFYEAHTTHHVRLYPPGKLISEKYRDAGQHNTAYTFIIAFIPILAIPVALYFFSVISLTTLIVSISMMIIVGLLNDLIHDSFHVKNHWVGQIVPNYHHMRRLHFAHHVNVQQNFGIYGFFWDQLFRTYKKIE